MRIEGKNAVFESVAAGTPIDRLYVDKSMKGDRLQTAIESVRAHGGKIEFVDAERLDRMSAAKRHQGIIAQTREYEYATLDELLENPRGEHRFLVLLDGIADPHNLGACIRAAECAGADGVVISERRCAPVNETVVRVSAGAAAHLRVARVGNLNDAIRRIKREGVRVLGAELGGSNLYDADLAGDLALVIGSEGEGMHRLTKELCDEIVTLPVCGSVNSLNASVACGVVLYEAVRQRTR